MNILTHPVHTGYQYDLSKTGHQFYSLDIPGSGEVFWDNQSRPLPSNYHYLSHREEYDIEFDLALIHFELGFSYLQDMELPIIYKEHCIRAPFNVAQCWDERISHYSFASELAADSWKIPVTREHRKTVIGMGIDTDVYKNYTGEMEKILVVGQNIKSRGNEKGLNNLAALANDFDLTVVGRGNQGIPGAVGPATDYEELIRHYQSHRVFLNPSNTLGMSTLEAMATGLGVVSFPMINSDVIKNGINGLIVNSVNEAKNACGFLLKNPTTARMFGVEARETIIQKYKMENFVSRWNYLFSSVAKERHIENPKRQLIFNHQPPNGSLAKAASELIAKEYHYIREGYDHRRMSFLKNGRIGYGADRCELFWSLREVADKPILDISSDVSITCSLTRNESGHWAGRWNEFEKMPIALLPLQPQRKNRIKIARIAQ